MLKPAVTSHILKPGQSYYSLVVAVAKRARQIAEDAEESHDILVEKPVQIAVEEFTNNKYKLVEPYNIGQDIE
ncbi:DNA-directed RNA polymerase subunit omega [Zongyangia hominis]|uniref:DNA-directed RNA polymerase subunit omega n=1 Tax=Zongyangia hominis TaxID=2763677 RepID=A0A926EEE7_9FIRM|nr:DNA-directed RNA polymerase subunit omega [Zongyangia hominis]MBC8570919.1 DNA-directed RNA polymerase subunit omega [Zongyangia hominis]